jgi:hypothetical protein
MNRSRLAATLLLCGFALLPTTTVDAQGRPAQQSCRYIGEQTSSHTQVECDDNRGYLVDDLIVSTYDTSTPLVITTPQASWLVFRPTPGSGASVAVGWWDTQTQHICALSEANDLASMTCGEVEWPGG